GRREGPHPGASPARRRDRRPEETRDRLPLQLAQRPTQPGDVPLDARLGRGRGRVRPARGAGPGRRGAHLRPGADLLRPAGQLVDGVNFSKGANPPREQWKVPPQKSPEETKTAYESFETWVRFIKRFPDVQFVTASEAAKLYRDRARGRKFTPADLKAVAAAV